MSTLQRAASAIALVVFASTAHADLAYTFDNDAQGFGLVDTSTGTLTHEAGGYLRVADVDGNTNMFLQLPGSAVASGWAAYKGGTFSFDARLASSITSYWPEFGTVTLVSSLGSASIDLAADGEPGLGWKTYSIRLDEAAWGLSPTHFDAILANLQQVTISLEAGNGPIEVLHLDNVRVSAVPEPTSALLALMGVAGVGAVLRRRRA